MLQERRGEKRKGEERRGNGLRGEARGEAELEVRKKRREYLILRSSHLLEVRRERRLVAMLVHRRAREGQPRRGVRTVAVPARRALRDRAAGVVGVRLKPARAEHAIGGRLPQLARRLRAGRMRSRSAGRATYSSLLCV